ncbi:MAG: oligopeptidase A, partial [Burkholderiales bacterium]|nr:oligopeptidase A [Burkholderiales bacterium]
MNKNKLLCDFDFIPYGEFNLSELEQAIYNGLDNANTILANAVANTISSWEQTIAPLHECIYKLNRLWDSLNHLMTVTDSKEIRDVYNKLQLPITDFFVNLGQNKKLYDHYNNIKQNSYSKLTIEQQKVLDNEFRDFYLSGISLPYDKQQQFKQTENSLEQASTTFAQNVLDATDNFVKYVTQADIAGVPHDILAMLKNEALKDEKQDLYKLTLHMTSYLPIMQYCENRTLREEMYREYITRASEFSNQKLDNSGLISHILRLRQEKANILGFKHYSELSLYTKMADNYTQVLDFLYELARKSKPYAISDLTELSQFVSNKFGINHLEAWDIAFFSEKLQQEKYNYSTQELKQYFQLPTVTDGLFKLIYNLYQVKFQQIFNIPTWHTNVQVFAVTDVQNNIIGHLFLDLYSRNAKAQGAWMNSAQDKYKTEDQSYNPIAYVICNFTNPIGKDNSLLSFDEVQTLFHEMGHALHHLLTKIDHF